jgi:hypothetical protein
LLAGNEIFTPAEVEVLYLHEWGVAQHFLAA